MFQGWKHVEQEHVATLLGAVKRLFSTPDNWIVAPRAEDEQGREISPHSSQAAKWSLLGAGERGAVAVFEKPLCDYVECAMRDYLDDISDGKAIHGMSYDDEYALICLAYETLSPPSFEPITTPPITEATTKEKTE